jgi:hypothetical protein
VWSTFEAAIVFSAALFGVRFRVEGGSARTGAILIVDRNLWHERGQRGAPAFCRTFFNRRGTCYVYKSREGPPATCPAAAGKMPALPEELHDALTEKFVFSGEQILHEIITAFICVSCGAGEMMVDSHSCRATEIIRNGKNFVNRFTLTD